MADLKIQIDTAKLAEKFKEFLYEIEQDIRKAVGDLAAVTHAKVAELAQNELKTTRKIYMDNLGYEEVAPGVWIVYLDEKALWIEDGIPDDTDMKPGLLKNAKSGKNGTQYKVIPFRYDKPNSQNAPYTQTVVNQIKSKLKQEKISFKKIELDEHGSPKLGKLHEFDFGGDKPGKGNTSVMKGLSIYQNMGKNGKVRRDILTFRTVSSGPASAGKWIHPGLPAKMYMDKATDWALSEWENKILPEILNKWSR
jgi:hypothetical protein